ncbi:hypothetical protein QJS10_CPB11g01962 [Acorus calamus]|uniref:Uncharacterized protein n=1 Tax=Acorus calamus TaxID=4465 RepID=A0AAV9DQL8_ACOCL|nr:hypothetical protein QJS10_CPB11g01962 [Acorus calamus]
MGEDYDGIEPNQRPKNICNGTQQRDITMIPALHVKPVEVKDNVGWGLIDEALD